MLLTIEICCWSVRGLESKKVVASESVEGVERSFVVAAKEQTIQKKPQLFFLFTTNADGDKESRQISTHVECLHDRFHLFLPPPTPPSIIEPIFPKQRAHREMISSSRSHLRFKGA